MNRSARLSRAAETDLVEIWAYIAGVDSAAADRLLTKIQRQCQRLAQQPGAGRMRPELSDGIRSFPIGRYVVFYRERPDGIEVARVLSGYRDIPAQFPK